MNNVPARSASVKAQTLATRLLERGAPQDRERLLAFVAQLEQERDAYRRRFERAVLDGNWQIEVETGAACVAYYNSVLVTNGQSEIADCFDQACTEVWGEGGVMRPEFRARLRAENGSVLLATTRP